MIPGIVDQVRLRSETSPDELAYVFLFDDDRPETLTYRELAQRSAALATALADSGRGGDRVLLLLPPGIDYIIALYACLYAGRIAVPSYPPRPTRFVETASRIDAICKDAGASAAIATAHAASLVAASAARLPHLAGLRWIAPQENAEGHRIAPSAHELAILQYTSGSTGTPKGVVLGHDNLLFNLELMRGAFAHSRESVGVFWLPPYHDMGLIAGILEPLYVGYLSVLMSPASFAARPLGWLQVISRYRATFSGGPNFAYDLCVRRIAPAQRAEVDLRSWTIAFNGAEPVRAETLNRFAAAFADSGFNKRSFVACYGLAEATLLVACGARDGVPVIRNADPDALGSGRLDGTTPLVSCGQPAGDLRIEIVDSATHRPVADGTVGEIWVAGKSVARGYWRRPSDTTFCAKLAGVPSDAAFLRTGDLGARIDSELFVTGRQKDVIVVRGRNVYPQDIECAAEASHPAIQQAGTAAFSVETPGEGASAIAVVCELKREHRAADLDPIARAVRRAIATQCAVQAAHLVFVKPASIPKTTSGKIRRSACRDALMCAKLEAIGESRITMRAQAKPGRAQIASASGATRSAMIARLIVALAAERGAPAGGENASLLELVGDSLDAMDLATDLGAVLGVDIPFADMLGDVTVIDLATRVAPLMDRAAARPEPFPDRLSRGQAALWFTQQLYPSSSAYHMTVALRLLGSIDAEALARAIVHVSARHRQLRIAVQSRDGSPATAVAAAPALVGIAAHESEPPEQIAARFAGEPFDLEHGPLWRVALIEQREPVLVVCVHHMVADYASLQVMLDDLGHALSNGALPMSADKSADEYARLVADETIRDGDATQVAANRAYWLTELAHRPVLDLPSPGPRPSRPTHAGTQHETVLRPALVRALMAVAREHRATLHTVLMASLFALLHRWTGQEDIIIGTPVSSRRSSGSRDMVGYCVNPIPVRAHPRADLPFAELIREIRDKVIAGVAHELPFQSLIETLGDERDSGHTPVFQALFAYEKAPQAGRYPILMAQEGELIRFADLDAQPLCVRPVHVPFDLSIIVEASPACVAAAVQTSNDAVDDTCAQRLASQWMRLLEGAANAPATAVGALPLLSPAEYAFVVHDVNRTAAAVPGKCLHTMVAAQAGRTPAAIALIDGTRALTYRSLMSRASAVAHWLAHAGLGPESRVGLYMDRCADMIVAMLGILGAGCAYVYLDPRYPPTHTDFVAGDAHIAALLTRDALAQRIACPGTQVITLEQIAPLANEQWSLPETGVAPGNLAYVIYTSGSTGRPKGVAIEHRNAAALVGWALGEYDRAMLSGTLASTSLAFDLSVFEIFAPLSCGATVILADSALELPRLPARNQVTLVNTVPSAMAELIASGAVPRGVKVVNLAGEPLRARLADAVHALGHVERLYNLYGPTEDTTYSMFERVEPGAAPTLGYPLANRAAYLLDSLMQPVPIGVAGEIWLGGAGVAREYLFRPDITAQRFVESPLAGVSGRLYRTGDLGRRLADGRIVYLGRRDRQVKVRGFRVELDEVVSALLAHAGVTDAVAAPDDAQRLLAWVTASGSLDTRSLREHLQAALPPFMVPNRIEVLEQLPRLPNGKVDVRKLTSTPMPIDTPTQPGAGLPGPAETALISIWNELLRTNVEINDNFFALGGHSLLAARLQAKLRERFDVDVPLLTIFEQPTIERLAKVIASIRPRAPLAGITVARRGTLSFEELIIGAEQR